MSGQEARTGYNNTLHSPTVDIPSSLWPGHGHSTNSTDGCMQCLEGVQLMAMYKAIIVPESRYLWQVLVYIPSMLDEREALSKNATLGELFKLRVPEDLPKRKATRLGCPANTRSRRYFPIDAVRQLLREVFIYSEALTPLLVPNSLRLLHFRISSLLLYPCWVQLLEKVHPIGSLYTYSSVVHLIYASAPCLV